MSKMIGGNIELTQLVHVRQKMKGKKGEVAKTGNSYNLTRLRLGVNQTVISLIPNSSKVKLKILIKKLISLIF